MGGWFVVQLFWVIAVWGKKHYLTTSVLVKEYIHEKLLFMSIVLIDKVIGDYPHNISSSIF